MVRPVSSGERVKYELGVSQIRVKYDECISVLQVSDQPNGFGAPF